MKVACLDFETANRNHSSACALGIAMVENSTIVDTASWLIRPTPFEFEKWNIRKHGITADHVTDSPSFAVVWPEVSDFIGDAWLVAHNSSFDMSVLRKSLIAADQSIPECNYFCTLKLARCQWQGMPSKSLDALAATFDIDLEHHDALSDAKACAQLLLKAMEERGTSSILELLQELNISPRILGHVPSRSDSATRRKPEKDFYSGSLASLDGKKVSVTGEFGGFSRGQAEELIKAAGGEFHKKPKCETDIVVVGPVDARMLAKGKDMTSKLTRALELQQQGFKVEITTSDEFLEMLLIGDED
jgi:DNA polymerase-3 subunit epsilon